MRKKIIYISIYISNSFPTSFSIRIFVCLCIFGILTELTLNYIKSEKVDSVCLIVEAVVTML